MKNKIKHHLRRLILWAAGDYFAEQHQENVAKLTTVTTYARDHLRKDNKQQWQMLNRHITALQAIDAHYHETGKLILLATVQGQDMVKIIDVPTHHTLTEWKQLVTDLAERYGAQPHHIDSPTPSLANYIWEGKQHLRARSPGPPPPEGSVR